MPVAIVEVASFPSETDWSLLLVAVAVSESTVVLLSVAPAKLTGGLIMSLTDVSAVVTELVLAGLTVAQARTAEAESVLDGWE